MFTCPVRMGPLWCVTPQCISTQCRVSPTRVFRWAPASALDVMWHVHRLSSESLLLPSPSFSPNGGGWEYFLRSYPFCPGPLCTKRSLAFCHGTVKLLRSTSEDHTTSLVNCQLYSSLVAHLLLCSAGSWVLSPYSTAASSVAGPWGRELHRKVKQRTRRTQSTESSLGEDLLLGKGDTAKWPVRSPSCSSLALP